jgi:hypothetical protein
MLSLVYQKPVRWSINEGNEPSIQWCTLGENGIKLAHYFYSTDGEFILS